MPATDPALLSAEDMLALYARRSLSPVEVLQAVTERVARLNPGLNAFAVMNPRALDAAGESEMRWRVGRPLGAAGRRALHGEGPGGSGRLPDAPRQPHLRSRAGGGRRAVRGRAEGGRRGRSSARPPPPNTAGSRPATARCTASPATRGTRPTPPAARRPVPAQRGRRGLGRCISAPMRGARSAFPPAWCGLVGLKPTFGRVPIWPSSAFVGVSVAGPMTRTVRDAALMLSAMARYDVRDPFCRAGRRSRLARRRSRPAWPA